MQTVDGSNITLVESSEYSLLSNDKSSNTMIFVSRMHIIFLYLKV